MAEQEQLIIEISAETVGIVKSLATLENGLEDFAKEGKTTAATLTSALKTIKKEADNTFDARKLAEFNVATKEIRGVLSGIRSVGLDKVPKDLDKISESSRQARIAVYGLNQVVRDAPFGFIAISNNLPILFDQFGKLQTQTGGTVNALRSFGKTLFGPAGISIGISAVIGVVTSLIQEYGSLGKAVDALIGSTGRLSDEQLRYSEKLGSEIAEITLLVNAYPNLTASRRDQEGVLKKLNNLAPQYFSDLSTEKTSIDELTKSYDRYIKSFVAKIFIEQQTKALEEVAKSYAQELIKLIERERKIKQEQQNRLTVTQRQIKLQDELAKSNQNLSKGDIAVGIDIFVRQPPKTIQELISQATEKFKKDANELLDAQKGFFQALDFTGVFEQESKASGKSKKDKIDDINEIEKKRKAAIDKAYFDALDNEIKLLQAKIDIDKEYINSIDATSQESLQKRLQLLNDELELKKLQLGKEITDTKEYLRIVYELDLQLVKDREALYKTWADNRIKQIGRVLDAEMQYINQTTEESTKEDPGGSQRRIKEFFKTLGEQNKAIDESLKQQSKAYNDFAKNLASNFANIAGDLAEAFINGQNAAEVFRSSLKRLIADLAVTIAKAAILRTITSAIGGGGGFAASTGGLLGGGGGFNLFDFFGARAEAIAGNIPRPRGVNIGAGGMALAGNVTFVQRGTDLVGVLNAGNARIKRVG